MAGALWNDQRTYGQWPVRASGTPGQSLMGTGPSVEAPRSPCPTPVRGATDSKRTYLLGGVLPALLQRDQLLESSSRPGDMRPGLALVRGRQPWRGCPGLAFSCSPKECCRNGPLFGLVFNPPGALELPSFSQAFRLLQGEK